MIITVINNNNNCTCGYHTQILLIAITKLYIFIYCYLLQNCAALFYVSILDIDQQ